MTSVTVTRRGRVARLTIQAPPVNLYDARLERDLAAALDETENDPDVVVRVLESADPDFFLAHYDVSGILAEDTAHVRASVGPFTRFVQRWRDSEKLTIAKVRGAARGGGLELLLALDLRFASRERARFGAPESALGILAAGGGTQRLTALLGRARALELLLGHADLDADTAERWGLVNRSLPDQELDPFVDALADRIAALPGPVVRYTKLAVNEAARASEPSPVGFALEALLLDLLKAAPETRARLEAFLAAGGQTRPGELDFARLLDAARAAGA